MSASRHLPFRFIASAKLPNRRGGSLCSSVPRSLSRSRHRSRHRARHPSRLFSKSTEDVWKTQAGGWTAKMIPVYASGPALQITVGGQLQQVTMDTGSSVLWINNDECKIWDYNTHAASASCLPPADKKCKMARTSPPGRLATSCPPRAPRRSPTLACTAQAATARRRWRGRLAYYTCSTWIASSARNRSVSWGRASHALDPPTFGLCLLPAMPPLLSPTLDGSRLA